MTRKEAYALREKIERVASSQNDEDALNSVELFVTWDKLLKKGEPIPLNKRCQDGGILYECIQPHTPQVGWNPDLTPALWKRVSIEEWPAWIQPMGSEDAYEKGAHVSHNEKHWESEYDNNVWEPGVYGWVEK